jgi:hypothetical protein
MKLASTRHSYSDLIELSVYGDLKTSLRPNHRIVLSTNDEFERIVEILTENNVHFVVKSKKEILIEQ